MNSETFKEALLIREFEETLLKLFSKGLLNGTVHTCVGQELIPAVLKRFIAREDIFFSNHRGHGHYLIATNDYLGLIAEVMGKKNGCSKGFGGSQHLFKKNRYYGNGIQGGMAPVSVGNALSKKINSEPGIIICFIGDGTLGEGTLYEALNCASIFQVPILFVLENNQYAQSTSVKQTFAGDIRSRIEGFGLDYYKTNIWDYENLENNMKEATNNARNNKPSFIEIECYRLNSHSKGDDNRDKDEVFRYREIDPINVFESSNIELTLEIRTEVDRFLNEIVDEAMTMDELTIVEKESLIYNKNLEYKLLEQSQEKTRLNALINEGIKKFITENDNHLFIGEDIEYTTVFTPQPYGGAFKVTGDLSGNSNNIKNSPISEAAITGIGIGAALGGVKSIVEIMFGDFMTLTFDQLLQHASKFTRMYGERLKLPFLLRSPMGGGRGYGPTHSQSIEKHFIGLPGLKVLALNYRVDASSLYYNILSNYNEPILVIENKQDYTRFTNEKFIETHEYYLSNSEYPVLKLKPKLIDPAVTLVCYGGTLKTIEDTVYRAFIEHEISVEVICYTEISPINISPIIYSLSKTKKLLTVEEGSCFSSFGTEVLSQVILNGIKLDGYKKMGNENIIPSSFAAEKLLLPNEQNILENIIQIS